MCFPSLVSGRSFRSNPSTERGRPPAFVAPSLPAVFHLRFLAPHAGGFPEVARALGSPS